MPVFEYRCQECSEKFEVLHKSTVISEEITCPRCQSTKNKKLFSSFSPKSHGHSDFGGCSDGSCENSLPGGGCSSGMCGLN